MGLSYFFDSLGFEGRVFLFGLDNRVLGQVVGVRLVIVGVELVFYKERERRFGFSMSCKFLVKMKGKWGFFFKFERGI